MYWITNLIEIEKTDYLINNISFYFNIYSIIKG